MRDDPFQPAGATFLLNLPQEKTEREARDRIQRIFYRLHWADVGERCIIVRGSLHSSEKNEKGYYQLTPQKKGYRAYLEKK